MNITELAKDYLVQHEIYMTALKAENAALKAQDTQNLSELISHRLKLGSTFEVALSKLGDLKESLAELDPALKAKLRAAQEEFEKESKINMEALEHLKLATENVIRLVVGTLQQTQSQKTVFYNAYGTIRDQTGDTTGTMLRKLS